jgi:hypothetical protein
MVSEDLVHESVVTQQIMAEGHGIGKLLTLWQPGNRESEREQGLGTRYILQKHTPVA